MRKLIRFIGDVLVFLFLLVPAWVTVMLVLYLGSEGMLRILAESLMDTLDEQDLVLESKGKGR